MGTRDTYIQVKGKKVQVAGVTIDGFDIVTTGKWLKSALIKSEDFVDRDPAEDPSKIIAGLREKKVHADLFAFSQRPPDVVRRFPYSVYWDNVAALPILGFSEWWEKRLNQDTRRCVRVASKRGLVVRPAHFDDEFCLGIQGIYNETPIRQGRKFWHYGKDFEAVKEENSTFADRSEYIGAYSGAEMVGFLKMVYVGNRASIMQILSKVSHYEQRPMNALMAVAVEICNERKLSYLIYRKYVYHGGLPDSLTEFKRRNGFEQVNVPRYFVPLTPKGRIAVALRLHLGASDLLPRRVLVAAKTLRNRLSQIRTARKETEPKDS